MNKHTAALFVVLLGWAFGLATTYMLKPDAGHALHEYTMFYVNATQLRNALFVVAAILLFKVGGSIPIFVLMGFNLAACLLNISYLDPSNYALLSPWRVGYFAPAYRIAELTIITWAAYNARDQILANARRFCYSLRAVVVSWRLFNKGNRS